MAFTRMVSDYSELVMRCVTARSRCRFRASISTRLVDSLLGTRASYSHRSRRKSSARSVWAPCSRFLASRRACGGHRPDQGHPVRRTPVDQSNQRFGNKNNSRPQLKIESSVEIPRIAAPPRNEPTSHSHLRVIQTGAAAANGADGSLVANAA